MRPVKMRSSNVGVVKGMMYQMVMSSIFYFIICSFCIFYQPKGWKTPAWSVCWNWEKLWKSYHVFLEGMLPMHTKVAIPLNCSEKEVENMPKKKGIFCWSVTVAVTFQGPGGSQVSSLQPDFYCVVCNGTYPLIQPPMIMGDWTKQQYWSYGFIEYGSWDSNFRSEFISKYVPPSITKHHFCLFLFLYPTLEPPS